MNKYFMRFFDENFHNKLPYILKTALICFAAAVLVSQAGLLFEGTRSLFTGVDILDGAIPASSGTIAEKGRVTLSIADGEPGEEISVLVNGDEYCRFDKQTIDIEINNQSVIEVVNNSKYEITVRVDSISDNLYTAFSNGEVTVDNIAVLCRVIFN